LLLHCNDSFMTKWKLSKQLCNIIVINNWLHFMTIILHSYYNTNKVWLSCLYNFGPGSKYDKDSLISPSLIWCSNFNLDMFYPNSDLVRIWTYILRLVVFGTWSELIRSNLSNLKMQFLLLSGLKRSDLSNL